MYSSILSARVRRMIDWTTATTLRARWSTSSASRIWRSSARFRSVMSDVTPLSQIGRPISSKLAAAVPVHQRTSPFGRRTRNSVWKVLVVLVIFRKERSNNSKSSGLMSGCMLSSVGTNVLGSNSENFALTLIPDDRAARHVPLPTTHLSSSKCEAAHPLTLPKLQCGRRECCGTLGDARLEFLCSTAPAGAFFGRAPRRL